MLKLLCGTFLKYFFGPPSEFSAMLLGADADASKKEKAKGRGQIQDSPAAFPSIATKPELRKFSEEMSKICP